MVKNLRRLRTSKCISQQQLADVIGTSQQSINKYENHSVEPDISTLTKLADYFDTTIDYLVGHESGPTKENLAGDIELTKDEYALVCYYHRLSKEEKDSIRLVIRNYLKNRGTLE